MSEVFSEHTQKGAVTFDGATVKGAIERLRSYVWPEDVLHLDFYDNLFSLIGISNPSQRAVLSRSFLCYVIAWERYESSDLSEVEFFKKELSE